MLYQNSNQLKQKILPKTNKILNKNLSRNKSTYTFFFNLDPKILTLIFNCLCSLTVFFFLLQATVILFAGASQ